MAGPRGIGIGIDLVSVERIEKILNRWGDRFLRRIYTDQEITYCLAAGHPARSFAARFAAKEALIKAISRWSGAGIKLRNIEVVIGDAGVPGLKLSGTADVALGTLHAYLSISHEKEFAVAVVVTLPEVKT